MYEQYVSALADLFFPQRCVGCDRRTSDLHWRDCFEALPRAGRPVCARRGTPTVLETFFCSACKGTWTLTSRAPPASLRYEGVGGEIVHALKYRGYAKVVERLSAPLMLGVLDRDGRFDAVVPVPLHRSRLRRCGFNQAELLARGVTARLDAPVFDTLEAVRRTRDQVELTAAERRANVEGAYALRGRVRGRVLLVDHVFTTGATMSACAETLLRGGQRRCTR